MARTLETPITRGRSNKMNEDGMTLGNIMNLEAKALERLTEDRRLSGSLGEEVEEMLNSSGIYWDSLNEEYFNIDHFQAQTYQRVAAEYASQYAA